MANDGGVWTLLSDEQITALEVDELVVQGLPGR